MTDEDRIELVRKLDGAADFVRSRCMCAVSTIVVSSRASFLNGYCLVPYGGKEIIFAEYEVATGKGLWGRARPDYAGALIGGWETERKLVVCRVHYVEVLTSARIDHGQHPGKVVDGQCNFGFGGKERASSDFEVFYPNN
jgi:hypothetical protein